ncbi:MAG: LytR/AlgR family response regulator transcription factor [Cyclobacteriaceae bacterium]
MQISAIALDDSPSALDIIKRYATKVPSLSLAVCFTSPFQALAYLEKHSVDTVFIDIEMDDLNGIEFIKIIKNRESVNLPKFIITSAHERYAIDGFDLNITDFLLKPISFHRFLEAIEKVRKAKQLAQIQNSSVQSDYLFVRDNGKIIKVRYKNILFIQSDGHFVKIHQKGKRHPLMLFYKIAQMEKMLPLNSFIRTHKQYIINIEHIAEIDSSSVSLEHVELPIPVGGTYRQKINQLYNFLNT